MHINQIQSVSIIGAGNVATHMAKALHAKGITIDGIYNRSLKAAVELADLVNSKAYTIEQLSTIQSDLLILSLSDKAIADVLEKIQSDYTIVVHTSGSIGIDILNGKFPSTGVFYPLQTFSKNVELNFDEIPLCIEGSSEQVVSLLKNLAHLLTQHVYLIDSVQRQQIHLAAVFACNFVNLMYTISEQILAEKDIPFDILKPLISETARKVQQSSPWVVQTGPAVRNDKNVLEKHADLLTFKPELRSVYKQLSNHIIKFYKK